MQSERKLIFDIGANLGRFSNLYCENYSVIAVEANPALANRLSENSKFITESCAIGSECGTVSFHVCSDDQMSSCNKMWLTEMRYKTVGIQNTIEVPCVTLDHLVQKYGIPFHIKIDTEGYELQVVTGLSHKINSIQFEYIGEEFLSLTLPVIRRLKDLGYDKYVIKELCGDFEPNSYEDYERSNTYNTADQMMNYDGSGFVSGMILAF